MSVPVYLYPPNQLANKNIVDFFKTEQWPKRNANEIVLDFRNVEFIAPWAICLYGAYACWMREEYKCEIQIKGNPTTRAGSYIARSGLPDLVRAAFPPVDAVVDQKTIQLSKITTSNSISPLAGEILKLLDMNDREMEGATQYSIVELVRNAVQHSQSITGGMVMAQFYPQPGEVDVIVADMGAGIRATLGTSEKVENDTQALTQAIRPHISGTFEPKAYGSMKDNAGLAFSLPVKSPRCLMVVSCWGRVMPCWKAGGMCAASKQTNCITPRRAAGRVHLRCCNYAGTESATLMICLKHVERRREK